LYVTGDAVLDWNAALLQANANDYDPTVVKTPDEKGPTGTSRAFAIVHAAIYDAVNSIDGSYEPYLGWIDAHRNASISAAVAYAAHDTLVVLYPSQVAAFDAQLAASLQGIPPGKAKHGKAVGQAAAANILAARTNDGSQTSVPYVLIPYPGYHRPDPLHPTQGFLGTSWGSVKPFVMDSGSQYRPMGEVGATPPERLQFLNSAECTQAFNEVYNLGSLTSAFRTPDQTEIGIFWSYDGSPQLGTPPRLYNQIMRTVAGKMRNSMVENSRLFALVNLAMADAGIAAWDCKYAYSFWRPIVGIRLAASAGNPYTTADPNWQPLGAQSDSLTSTNFTPNFPSYVSGHATFGSAMFQILREFYDTDRIPFAFQSDEYNGVTRDDTGVVRPRRTRFYDNLTQPEIENHDSRIYLGVHWRFDQDQGLIMGRKIGHFVIQNVLQPRDHDDDH
jgi:hypothetical protein